MKFARATCNKKNQVKEKRKLPLAATRWCLAPSRQPNPSGLDIPARIRRRQIEFSFRFTAVGVKARL